MPSSFWPQCAAHGVPPSRTRAAGALWGAPREEAREARLARGGGAVVLLRPPGGGACEVLIAGRARGRELLGNRPTLPSASPRPPAGAAAAPAAAAAATARSSVGGTLVKHEVTAAHTRSLFCSLQLFFSPLALIVVMPTVNKSS